MAITLASNLAPSGGQSFYLLEDIYIKGSLQIRESISERDQISPTNLKMGALVMTLSDNKIWKVTTLDLPSIEDPELIPYVEWTELELGGSTAGDVQRRQVVIHTLDNLGVDSSEDFSLILGSTSVILKLMVSRKVKVKAFSTPDRDDPNPYEFLATDDHLIDDGSQLLADGSIFRTRNFSIFSNMEEPVTNNIYFTIESVDGVDGPVVMTITYIPMEAIADA